MWGCNYFPFSRSFLGGFFPGGIVSLLIGGLVVFVLVYLATTVFRSLPGPPARSRQDRNDSMAILKARFARGEISEEEYARMERILSDS
jgi:putative membrane protein